jgi:hypothetical protein
MATEIEWDFLTPLLLIPSFKEDVNLLRKKYGFPIKYYRTDVFHLTYGRPWDRRINTSDNGEIVLNFTKFCEDFYPLREKIIVWLKKEFPFTSSSYMFKDSETHLQGIEVWLSNKTRLNPIDQIGYKGTMHPYFIVEETCKLLNDAYNICKNNEEMIEKKMREEMREEMRICLFIEYYMKKRFNTTEIKKMREALFLTDYDDLLTISNCREYIKGLTCFDKIDKLIGLE